MATATPAQQAQIANLYVALFNRAPGAADLTFWSDAIAKGASMPTITQGFLTAPESATIYPQGQTGAEFVAKFYPTVFGRAVDAGGLAFWTAALESSGGAASTAARAMLVSQIVSIVAVKLAGSTAAGSFVVGGTNLASVALISTYYGNAIAGIVLGPAVNAVTIDAQNALAINQGFGLVGGKSGLAVTVRGAGPGRLGQRHQQQPAQHQRGSQHGAA